jgi:hypothetical protein
MGSHWIGSRGTSRGKVSADVPLKNSWGYETSWLLKEDFLGTIVGKSTT